MLAHFYERRNRYATKRPFRATKNGLSPFLERQLKFIDNANFNC